MIFYDGILNSGSNELVEKANLITPNSLLNRAIETNESFTLFSRDIVFDMHIEKSYNENSMRNCVDHPGRILSAFEDIVLNYENGYVIRVSDSLKEIKQEIDKVISDPPETFRDTIISPVSEKAKAYLLKNISSVNWGHRRKIIHLSLHDHCHLSDIIFNAHSINHIFNIDDSYDCPIKFKIAKMVSTLFVDIISIEDVLSIMKINKKEVEMELYNYGIDYR